MRVASILNRIRYRAPPADASFLRPAKSTKTRYRYAIREEVMVGIDSRLPFACAHLLRVTRGPVSLTPCCLAVSRKRPS